MSSYDLENMAVGLARFGEVSTDHIKRLWFPHLSDSSLEKQLTELRKEGWVDFRRWSVYDRERKQTIPQPALWHLTQAGHQTFKQSAQYPDKPARLRPRKLIQHDQRTRELQVRLIEWARPSDLSGITFFYEERLDPDHRRPVMDCLMLLELGGGFHQTHLVPFSDAPVLEWETPFRYAIEADNNSESGQIIRQKARAYRGIHEDADWRRWWLATWGPLPTILWAVPDQQRLHIIQKHWQKVWRRGSWLLVDDAGLQANELVRYRQGDVQRKWRIVFPSVQPEPSTPPAPAHPESAPTPAPTHLEIAPSASAPPPPVQPASPPSAAPSPRSPPRRTRLIVPAPPAAPVQDEQQHENEQQEPPASATPHPGTRWLSGMGRVLLLLLRAGVLITGGVLIWLEPLLWWYLLAVGVLAVLLWLNASTNGAVQEWALSLLLAAGMIILLVGSVVVGLRGCNLLAGQGAAPNPPPPAATATADRWATCGQGTALVDGLRMRAGPGLEHAYLGRNGDAQRWTLDAGEQVGVLCSVPVAADGYIWRRIFPWDGAVIDAWIATQEVDGRHFVDMADAPAAP
jgi:hypothetical protein